MAGRAVKRVTVNLPRELLQEAEEITGQGITETLVAGLKLLAMRSAYRKAMALRGKLDLRIDIETSRERNRR
jgi:hypothetical protein